MRRSEAKLAMTIIQVPTENTGSILAASVRLVSLLAEPKIVSIGIALARILLIEGRAPSVILGLALGTSPRSTTAKLFPVELAASLSRSVSFVHEEEKCF